MELLDDIKIDLDLGDSHTLRYHGWYPDRDLNPQHADMPDMERIGATVAHKRADNGKDCLSAITFDSEVARRVFPANTIWQVQSWQPLTISPSLLCRLCGDHGFIREGKWVRA